MGHGHVIPNPDGSKARCGGPKICTVCALEAAKQKPRPIMILCEGSGNPTHGASSMLSAVMGNICTMCGELVAVDPDGLAYSHTRNDILAMLDRGDFDPPRTKAAPIRTYCAPCKGTGQQWPPGGRHSHPCVACNGEGVR